MFLNSFFFYQRNIMGRYVKNFSLINPQSCVFPSRKKKKKKKIMAHARAKREMRIKYFIVHLPSAARRVTRGHLCLVKGS